MKFLCKNRNTKFDQTQQVLVQTDVYSERKKKYQSTRAHKLNLFFSVGSNCHRT